MLNKEQVQSWGDVAAAFNNHMDAADDEWRQYYFNRPIEFIEHFFFTYDTAELLTLFPFQKQPLREALRRNPDGTFVYRTIIWSWMKKSAKSTVIAAIADWVAMTKPHAAIKLIGNDLKQADSRVGMYMRRNIEIGQQKLVGSDAPYAEHVIAARNATRIKTSGYAIYYPAGSHVEMIPIDPRGEAGGNDDMIVFSELWGWKHKAAEDMWAEMTISPTRYGYAQQWIDTYAGFIGASPILENLYNAVVKEGERMPFPDNPYCYRTDGVFATWVTEPLGFPWQTEAYYKSERKVLTKNQFARLHRNQWVTDENAFIDIDWWDRAGDKRHPAEGGLPLLRPDEPIVIGMDAGIKSDCFAIVAVSRDPRYQATFRPDADGDYKVRADERFIKRYSRVWQGSKEHPLKFYSDNPADITPESELKRLISSYNVFQVCFDPYQLLDFANRMEDETGAWFDEFSQQTERLIGDKLLYDIIRKGGLAHGGIDTALRSHLMNAGAKINSDDARLRIVKLHDDGKIDLAVALAMSVKRASDEIPK